MNRASSQMRRIAKRMLVTQASEDVASGEGTPLVFPTVESVRPHLSLLMGPGGFQALLARALVLAIPEAPWLSSVRVATGGELDGLTVAREAVDPADFSEGEVVLLAQLLGLLVSFIGPALTARLINQQWPLLSLSDADFGATAKSEEAN